MFGSVRRWMSFGILTAGIAANATAGTGSDLVWSHVCGPNGQMGKAVAIGDYGSQALTQFDGIGGFARLLSSYSNTTALPIWQSAPVQEVLASCVDAAEAANVFTTLTLQKTGATAPLQLMLTRYTPASPTPVWQRELPVALHTNTQPGLAVARDGARIVTWAYDWNLQETKLFVHDAAGNLLLTKTVITSLPPMAGKLSGNGNLLYMTAPHWDIVIDLQSGSVLLHELVGASIGSAMDISGDGQTLASARGEGIVQTYRREGASYVPWFTVTPSEAMTLCTTLTMSGDGTTLAVGFRNPFESGKLKLQVFDLASSAHPMVKELTFPSSPSYLYFSALEASTDGGMIVAGTVGDVGGPVPELIVLERNGATWSETDEQLVCGVTSLRMHENSRMFAVCVNGLSAAANYAPWGEIDLFDRGQHDLWDEGVPHVGSTISIKFAAGPGTTARLMMSPAMALTPTVFPFGALYLDASTLTSAGGGVAGADGIISTSIPLPSGAAAVGTTYCFQGVAFNPRKLSNDAVKVTVLP